MDASTVHHGNGQQALAGSLGCALLGRRWLCLRLSGVGCDEPTILDAMCLRGWCIDEA